MKYVFFGTPRFAEIVLEKLLDAGIVPVAVVCNPDRPVGRKKVITAPPVKLLAQRHGNIQIFQPENVVAIHEQLKTLHPDVFVVAAYAKILKRDTLTIPRLGVIGVHPSLLPNYRGATPIQSAILAGERESGTTLFLIDEGVDHGPIITARVLPIADGEDYEALEKRLAVLGGALLVKVLPDFIAGKVTMHEQDHARATFTKKYTTQDGFIEFADLQRAQTEGGEIAVQVDRTVRALGHEPGVWTMEHGKRMKLLKTRIIDGTLDLLKRQYDGEKPRG